MINTVNTQTFVKSPNSVRELIGKNTSLVNSNHPSQKLFKGLIGKRLASERSGSRRN